MRARVRRVALTLLDASGWYVHMYEATCLARASVPDGQQRDTKVARPCPRRRQSKYRDEQPKRPWPTAMPARAGASGRPPRRHRRSPRVCPRQCQRRPRRHLRPRLRRPPQRPRSSRQQRRPRRWRQLVRVLRSKSVRAPGWSFPAHLGRTAPAARRTNARRVATARAAPNSTRCAPLELSTKTSTLRRSRVASRAGSASTVPRARPARCRVLPDGSVRRRIPRRSAFCPTTAQRAAGTTTLAQFARAPPSRRAQRRW